MYEFRAHKHAEMIKAKVDNMELVVFVECDDEWFTVDADFPKWSSDEYFLCHRQNKDATLHLLNGGEVQFMYKDDGVGMSHVRPKILNGRRIWI